MILKIAVPILKKFLEKHPRESISDAIQYYRNSTDHIEEMETSDFKPEELNVLLTIAEGCVKEDGGETVKGAKSLIRKINTFLNIHADPGGKPVARLESLKEALTLYLKPVPKHWLFTEEHGFMVPYYVEDIEYHPYDPRSETAAHTTLTMKALIRGDQTSARIYWEAWHLEGGKTVPELLNAKGYYPATPELLATYEVSMQRYSKLYQQTGAQFIADGAAENLTDRYSHGTTALVQDGIPSKLVMDDENEEGGARSTDRSTVSDAFWKEAGSDNDEDNDKGVALPIHPFVKVFDLDHHAFLRVHTDQLIEYEWNPALGEKLILPPAHKEVVTILMDTASEDIDDIIKGKSGGTIVICTGEPGTGKTLTAEITSEVIQRPLYKVQCSQLGTDEESIESELTKVLNRAARWKALLLIDEADVYVRERGSDIQQNAIVGVFLRVLEYYRGILFLTSNRATVIDDAIMSRATVHLKYEKPDKNALKSIWTVLSTQFGLKMSSTFIDELVKTFPRVSGRDVKALLKLAIRYSRRKDNKITLALFKLLAVHKDIEVAGLGNDFQGP